jgi:hypothetical protein
VEKARRRNFVTESKVQVSAVQECPKFHTGRLYGGRDPNNRVEKIGTRSGFRPGQSGNARLDPEWARSRLAELSGAGRIIRCTYLGICNMTGSWDVFA